jgi:hypothetical protein
VVFVWRKEMTSMHAGHTVLRTAVLALCALPMHGQTANTGAIAGTVSDPSGALEPSAAVVINRQGTGEKATVTVPGTNREQTSAS